MTHRAQTIGIDPFLSFFSIGDQVEAGRPRILILARLKVEARLGQRWKAHREKEKEGWSGSWSFHLVLLYEAVSGGGGGGGREASSSFVCRQSRIAKGRAHTRKAICHVGPV